MSHEILQNRLEKKSDSEAFKPSEMLHLARNRMLMESESSGNDDIAHRYPFRFQGVYCGSDVHVLIRDRKVNDSRDLFLTPEGSPEFARAQIQVSGENESVLYTYAGTKLYVSDSIDQVSRDGQEHVKYGNPIEVTGTLAQIFNFMMLDVERPNIVR